MEAWDAGGRGSRADAPEPWGPTGGCPPATSRPLGICGRVRARPAVGQGAWRPLPSVTCWQLQASAQVESTANTERHTKGVRVSDPRIHQIKEHLYSGLAIIDLVGHTEELNALWRRDSVAYALRLAFREWKAADDLLSGLEEDLPGPWRGGPHGPSSTIPGHAGPAQEPPKSRYQP